MRHLDVPNLRGREVPQDHGRERERSGIHHDTELEVGFNFGSAEEAEGGSAEEFGSRREGSSRQKEPKPAKHRGDESNKGEKAKTEIWSDVVKGMKTKYELETANSDESRNRSEAADSVCMLGSKMSNQLKAKRKKRQ